MSDDYGPILRGGGDDGVDRTYDERWRGDGPSVSDDAFGPVQRGRRRRLRGLAWGALKSIPTMVIALVLLVVVGAVALGVYSASRIRHEQVDGLGDGGARLNVLVVGSDSREGLTPEELLQLGTEQVEGRRTDTIFLLSADGGRAAILSFPRDLYVTRCDGTQGRINGAYALGGPSCLVQTVSDLTGIPIDHYVEVNLFGFWRIVDAVGGVPIYLEQPLVDAAAGVNLPAGCHVLTGPQAVGFVRSREGLDLARIARQQRFLKSLAGEVISPNSLVNVPRMFRVAGAAGSALTADQNLGLIELFQLARAARGLAVSGLATYTVPGGFATIGGAAVIVPTPEAAGLFGSFADGTILDVPVDEDVRQLQPQDVPVTILNGAGVDGLAAIAEGLLEARGFMVTNTGNAEPAETTTVRHPPGQEAAAALVASQIPGATTIEDETLAQVTLVLAPGVDLSAPPPPPPSEQPSAPPEGVPNGAAPVPQTCG